MKFDTKKIQAPGRIILPSALLDNLGLKVGKALEIWLDTEKEQIILMKINEKNK